MTGGMGSVRLKKQQSAWGVRSPKHGIGSPQEGAGPPEVGICSPYQSTESKSSWKTSDNCTRHSVTHARCRVLSASCFTHFAAVELREGLSAREVL